MLRVVGASAVRLLAAMALLAAAGCGGTDGDESSDPTGSTSQKAPEVTDDVSLQIVDTDHGSVLAATNDSGAKLLVLLPEGEPEQSKSSDGVTLRYVRTGPVESGDEPELYEAAALATGVTKRLDLSTVGTWTSKVAICLETVPWEDVASEVGRGTYRVQARAEGVDPTVACSAMGKIPAS